MTIRTARSILSAIWLLSVGALLLLLILRQLHGFYGDDAKEVWSWVSQFMLPGLTLVAGAWTVTAATSDKKRIGNPMVFWAALVLTVFYLSVAFLVVATQARTTIPWADVFKQSALYLGIIQGLVIGVLGKFFIESNR